MRAAEKTDYALHFPATEDMDDRRTVEIVPLAEFQGGEGVPKAGRQLEIGCPLIHIPKEQPGLHIFQDCFHLAFLDAVGVLIFDN